jgi:cephalosporin-C deacetylase
MPHYDLPAHELPGDDPRLEAPADLNRFWEATLAETRAYDLDPVLTRVRSPLVAVETFDVSWRGFGGAPIRGWLHLPPPPLRPHGLRNRAF